MLDDVLATLEQRRHQSLESLKHLLSIPSVSAQYDHADDMKRCATWIRDQLAEAEMKASVMDTGGGAGHPIVIAKNKHISGRPTVLFYGHYDVQPPEPLELWNTPPFEPTQRGGRLFARGAADDKGQFWCHIEAITAWQAHGGVPVNLTVMIEGEEEVGSEHLEAFVQQHKEELKCDIAVVSDTGQFARGTPAITYGLRGLLYAELFITGTKGDLHSGIHGGAAPNAANALAGLLGSLHNTDGTVNLPGFYQDVIALTDTERNAWKQLPFSEDEYRESLGVTASPGEAGYSVIERRWARPTCDINGITAGYQGQGAKTVIPARASAKVSFRLVPGQDPQAIKASFEQAMRERLLAGCSIEFKFHGANRAVLVPQGSQAMKLAAEAVEQGFGAPPAMIREGGSIPIVEMFKRELKTDTLLIGFGLPDDNLHAPNEKFDLDAFYAGQRTAAVLYERLSKLPTTSLMIA